MTSILTRDTTKARRARMIAMVWAPHEARTALFAKRLNVPVFYVHYLLYKRPYIAPFKYVLQAFKTWWILIRERPRVVYVTNPPVFAPLCVWLYSLFTGTKLVIDTHPPSLYARRWAWTVPLQRFLIKRAYVNIIDQQRFADLFESWGARVIILQKPPRNKTTGPLSTLTTTEAEDARETTEASAAQPIFEVAVVNTFAVDEPLDIILEAAKELPQAHFSITGDVKMAPPEVIENAPANVTFTDYLRGDAYWTLIHKSNAVMVLTTYPHSLLGGAQDGVALGKPLLLSDQPALREFFTAGAVFVPNTAVGIVTGVRQAICDEAKLITDVKWLGLTQEASWQARFNDLLQAVEQVGTNQ